MNKTIKTEIAVGILLIIIAIVGGFIWLGNRQQRSNQSTAHSSQALKMPSNNIDSDSGLEKSPEWVLREYYTSRINFLNKKTDVDNKLNKDFVTDNIIQSHQEFSKGKMLADPFLCAQDYPDDASKLSISRMEKTSSSAEFKVTIFTNWPTISVTMIKDGERWKIDGIACSYGSKL